MSVTKAKKKNPVGEVEEEDYSLNDLLLRGLVAVQQVLLGCLKLLVAELQLLLYSGLRLLLFLNLVGVGLGKLFGILGLFL